MHYTFHLLFTLLAHLNGDNLVRLQQISLLLNSFIPSLHSTKSILPLAKPEDSASQVYLCFASIQSWNSKILHMDKRQLITS